MSNEAGTKPAADAETKPTIDGNGTPPGTAPATAAPSTPAQPPSEDWKAKYEDSIRGMNDAQRRAAEYETELARERAALDAYRGREAAAADPVTEARKRWQEARTGYSPDEPELLDRYLELRSQRDGQAISQQTLRQMELNQSVPKAAEMLGIADRRSLGATLHGVANSLTPDELALVELNRRGKLDEYAGKSKKQREEIANRAALLDRLGSGQSGGRHIPGSAPDDDTIPISFQDWATLSEDAKNRHRKSPQKIAVYGAPKNFDPSKE